MQGRDNFYSIITDAVWDHDGPRALVSNLMGPLISASAWETRVWVAGEHTMR